MPFTPKRQPNRRHRGGAPRRSEQKHQRGRRPPPAERQPEKPLPPVDCGIDLDAESVAALADRMRENKKAHPFFESARKILSQPRHLLFELKPRAGATVKFHVCAACGEPHLDAAGVVEHQVLHHSNTLFSVARTEIEPPKGSFSMMAVCGFCREPLCPPNFHRYTELLVAHHQRRHAREPFDEFKAAVKMSRDAEDVDAWKKSLSLRQEFQCKLCEQKFLARADLVQHLSAEHLAQLEQRESQVTLRGDKALQLHSGDLRRVIAAALRQQRKPAQALVSKLRRALNARGLQFFRTAAGHQFVSSIQPRRPQVHEVSEPLRLEILQIASAPARRGHKPTRKTLHERFCSPAPAETGQGAASAESPPSSAASSGTGVVTASILHAAIEDLILRGFLVEYLDGELDAPALAKEDATGPAAVAVPT